MRFSLKKKKNIFSLAVIVGLVVVLYLVLPHNHPVSPAKTFKASTPSAAQIPAASFNKNLYPTDVASSLWAVVNKGRALPSSYVPANLTVPNVPLRYSASDPKMQVRSDMAAALEAMFRAANQDGINLKLVSGYRSYDYQVSVYNGYVSASGSAAADTYSARPGHSEHQTGLAADLEPVAGNCELDQCFGDTPEGKWLLANSYKYGLIIRYQKGTQDLTGYEYEPWHVRYVGKDLAQQLHSTGQTFEQFFGLPTYADYPAQGLTLKT